MVSKAKPKRAIRFVLAFLTFVASDFDAQVLKELSDSNDHHEMCAHLANDSCKEKTCHSSSCTLFSLYHTPYFSPAAYNRKNGSIIRTIWALINSVVWLVVLGFGVLVCALMIPIIGLTKAQRLTWRIACIYFRICLWASSVSYTVIGLENLDPAGNYFFACNHQSDYDIPLMFAVVPFWLISIAKSSIAYIPIFGWAVALGGTIFIQRSNHNKAVNSLDGGCKALRRRPRLVAWLGHPARCENVYVIGPSPAPIDLNSNTRA